MEEENQAKDNTGNAGIDNKDEKNDEELLDIFSHLGKFEKNKQYQQLQKDLNSLKQNVDLMEEFTNKDKLTSKRKIFSNILYMDKDNNNKKNYSKITNNLIFRKKMSLLNNRNNSSSNDITISQTDNNNINRMVYKNINKKNIAKKKIRKNNLTQDKYTINLNNNNNKLINKTEVNNYNQYINGQKLPNIYLSSDKIGEINKENNNANSNSTRLPIIQDKNKSISPRKINLKRDNNNNNISLSQNRNYMIYKKIPLIKKNLLDNSIIQKYPSILNSRRSNSNSLNHNALVPHTDKIVRKMKEKNIKIKNRINYKINEHDLIDWKMKSKLKLAQWRYGIAEVQKYFIDLQAYGKPEEDELFKRKTFYDFVDDLIDEIKQTKQEKEIKSIEDKYVKKNNNDNKFGNIKKKDEKKKESDVLNEVDNAINKQKEIGDILGKVKLRKIKEKEKRDIIDKILFKCDIRRKAINDSTNKLKLSKSILNNSKESYKNNKSLSSIENEKNEKNDKSKNSINNDKINEIK